jgi:hypothetical protein
MHVQTGPHQSATVAGSWSAIELREWERAGGLSHLLELPRLRWCKLARRARQMWLAGEQPEDEPGRGFGRGVRRSGCRPGGAGRRGVVRGVCLGTGVGVVVWVGITRGLLSADVDAELARGSAGGFVRLCPLSAHISPRPGFERRTACAGESVRPGSHREGG